MEEYLAPASALRSITFGGVDRLALLSGLERVAGQLRRVGLGPVVDAVARRVTPRFESLTLEVDGLKLHAPELAHVHYVKELRDEAREAYLAELLRASAAPGATVLDVGAHIGYLTLQAARSVGPTGRVVAVEPNPLVIDVLEHNVSLNGYSDRVQIVAKALSDAAGASRLFVSGGGDTSSLVAATGPVTPVEVETVVGDDEFVGITFDVVKMDIEGGELAALRGLRETLAASDRVVLLIECNPPMLESAGASAEELIAWLHAQGFDVQAIDEERRALTPVELPLPPDRYVNLYCTRSR
jgi:FkbM family methyltransferase